MILEANEAIYSGSLGRCQYIQGSISATNATGSGEYFFKMNAYWNIVNLGIASWGLIQVRKKLTQKYSYPQNQLAKQPKNHWKWHWIAFTPLNNPLNLLEFIAFSATFATR